jgi:uncharacterized protein YkwD
MTKPTNSTGNTTDFVKTIVLAIHNRERAAVGVPPLVWNYTVAAQAKTWVEHLATQQAIVHSKLADWRVPVLSESIAGGVWPNTTPQYKVEQMVQFWVNEKPTRHYLGIVNPNAKSIGCATGRQTVGDRWDLLVCQYSSS